ncbi:MAG: aspartate--tRNA ligase [Candidatus Neomarinimicrobiota bacterium]
MFKRTHTCGELRRDNSNASVSLNGWVNTVRLHGQVVFVDVRDRYGKTQLVFNTDTYNGSFEQVKKLSLEDVISVRGQVQPRAAEAINPAMPTGEIEVIVTEMIILSEAAPLPFIITDRASALEDLRLKYRYLELRTEELQKYLALRHRTYQVVRNHLAANNFIEIETPVLMKSTPEGARDYLVPSRIHKGKFYALPQSPQTFKQLLMIGGFDRYFQIVKCFRDEDLRADRQPEFTQIDIEMSFIDEADIRATCEALTQDIFKQVIAVDLPDTFPIMTYAAAMENYGSDRPDLRFGLTLQDCKKFTDQSEFNAFKAAETVKGLVVPGGGEYSRKIIDELAVLVQKYGAKGLAWMKVDDTNLSGGISKFFSFELQQDIITELELNPGDILFLIGDTKKVVLPALGALRNELARREGLVDDKIYRPVWVTDFPMFDWDPEARRHVAMHHPFTAPHPDDIDRLESDPGSARSRGYDLVINGHEIAGGSIRIHDTKVQQKVFDLLNISRAEAQAKFGFLLEALTYGAPPHGGIAYGFDRLIMILAQTHQIRDVIAFPKTTSATSLMDETPNVVSEEQLKELGIQLIKR